MCAHVVRRTALFFSYMSSKLRVANPLPITLHIPSLSRLHMLLDICNDRVTDLFSFSFFSLCCRIVSRLFRDFFTLRVVFARCHDTLETENKNVVINESTIKMLMKFEVFPVWNWHVGKSTQSAPTENINLNVNI